MKKTSNLIFYLGGILSLINLGLFLSMRFAWIFVDNTIQFPRFISITFTQFFTAAMIIFCLFFILMPVIESFTGKRIKKAVIKIFTVMLLFFEIVFLALNFYLYMQLGNSKSEVLRQLLLNLPYMGAILLFLFLALLYPKTRLSQSKTFRLIVILSVIAVILLRIYDFGQVRITSGPLLQAVDQDTLAVIWTTNYKSTGEVYYGSDAAHMKTAYSSEDGLINANTRLHKVLIPTGDLSELVYQVSSTKINRMFQNNAEYGNTVKSPVISYQAGKYDQLSFYVLSDVHNNTKLYKDFLSDKKYDFLVDNGDALESVESFDVIVRNFLAPIGKYTDYSKLFYFVRGNHEARGAKAGELKNYLALPSDHYYYTFNAGPVFAIVLDSGEDKPDNHMEYSGLADFESYKQEETKWLETVLQSDGYQAAKYHVVFIHSPLNSYADQTESDYLQTTETTWRSMLSDAGIDVAFSGHTHKAQLLEPNDYGASFPTVIVGGDAWEEKDYLAVRADITAQQMTIYYEDINGSREEILKVIPKN